MKQPVRHHVRPLHISGVLIDCFSLLELEVEPPVKGTSLRLPSADVI